MKLNVPIVKSIFPMRILTVMKANIAKIIQIASVIRNLLLIQLLQPSLRPQLINKRNKTRKKMMSFVVFAQFCKQQDEEYDYKACKYCQIKIKFSNISCKENPDSKA
jgi:hypothetical protein